MNKKHLKEAIIFLFIITITLITNSFYKRQYIKSVAAQSHYDYTLSATQLDMKLGSIFSIYAIGNDAPKVKWYSSDPNVAIINSFGQVIAKSVGQTIITAKYKKECKDMVINVNKDASQDVLIYKDSTTIATAGEALNKININTYILTLSKNKYDYTGKHIKPKVSITSTDGHKLIKNKDYTVKYHDNKNPGKAQVLVTGIGDYTGSLVGTFIIEKSNEDAAMDPSNNSNNNEDTEVQPDSSNKTTLNYSPDTSTSSLTPTSPEKSKISSTRTQSYKNTNNKSNNSTKSNTSTKNNSSSNDQKKSTTSKENTKSSFTKSDSTTTHNSFEKSTTNTADNTSSDSSKNSSNSSNSNSSSTNTDSSNNSTDYSSSSSTTNDSTNSNSTESTSN